jgi:tRNA-splicing ligase RtcB
MEAEPCFGGCAPFRERRQHDGIDADWSVSSVTTVVATGQPFWVVQFVHSGKQINKLEARTCLVLFSHLVNLGLGVTVCDRYSKLAFSQLPDLPYELEWLAWLSLDSR